MVLAKRCDLNNDWKVDDQDLDILNMAIDTNDLSADIAPATKRDGIVGEHDFELLMQYLDTEIPEIGLITHWKLDETEGDIAYENIQGKDGNLQGEPLWQPDGGIVGGAIQLDGIDDYFSTGPVLNPTNGPMSVLTWVKGGAPGQVVLSQIGGVDWLGADSSAGNLKTELKGSGRGGKPLLSQTTITDGEWHRIGFVWDGTNRKLYVDSIVVAEDTQDNLASSDNGLYIGCDKGMETGTFWFGLIDDVRIYNRVVKP
jgi:hypothetical protein